MNSDRGSRPFGASTECIGVGESISKVVPALPPATAAKRSRGDGHPAAFVTPAAIAGVDRSDASAPVASISNATYRASRLE